MAVGDPPGLLVNGYWGRGEHFSLSVHWLEHKAKNTTPLVQRLRMFGAVPPLPLFAFMGCIGLSVPFLVSLAVLRGEVTTLFFPLLEGLPYYNLHVQICCVRSFTTSLTILLPYFCCFHSLTLLIILGHCFTRQLASPVLHSDHCVFDVHVTMHRDKVLIINQPFSPISQIYFGRKLHVSDSSSVHHQEFFTVHTAMVYVIQVC